MLAEWISVISTFIAAISVMIAAISFIVGVNAWRREYIGKQRIENAREILTNFYKVEDTIHSLRLKFYSTNETREARPVGANETKKETELVNYGHNFLQSYIQNEKVFNEFRSMKYVAMVTFGRDAQEPFIEIEQVLNMLLRTARKTANKYWNTKYGDYYSFSTKHPDEEDEIWRILFSGGEGDPLVDRPVNAVSQIERIVQQYLDLE